MLQALLPATGQGVSAQAGAMAHAMLNELPEPPYFGGVAGSTRALPVPESDASVMWEAFSE